MLEWIIIGWTFWFIVPTVIVMGLLLYAAAEEIVGFAVILSIVYILIIQICSNFNIVSWMGTNPWGFVKYLVLYIIAGIIFAISKFWFYLQEAKRKFDTRFRDFLDENRLNNKMTFVELPDEYKARCSSWMSGVMLPTLRDSTSSIVFWMAYWPWVGLWTLINNPLRWFYEEIKYQLGGLFKGLHQKIVGTRHDAMNEWKDVKKEENKPKSKKGDKSIADNEWKDS